MLETWSFGNIFRVNFLMFFGVGFFSNSKENSIKKIEIVLSLLLISYLFVRNKKSKCTEATVTKIYIYICLNSVSFLSHFITDPLSSIMPSCLFLHIF